MNRAIVLACQTAAFLCLAASASPAQALPPDRNVVYRIYDDVESVTRSIRYEITLQVHAETQGSDGLIGWHIQRIAIRQPGSESEADRVWDSIDPEFRSEQGLWWVAHADTEAPSLNEFVELPFITGVALPVSGTSMELQFALKAQAYETIQPEQPFPVTTNLSATLWKEGEEDPDDLEPVEPVEVDDDPEA